MKTNNDLKPATAEELDEAMRRLEQSPRWQRMKLLQGRRRTGELTPAEAEELEGFAQPEFRDGDVIQEFVRDLKAAKAKDREQEPG
jgi:hypothetical protein